METGLVYGYITLTLLDRNTGLVKIGGKGNKIDRYDFDQKTNEKHRWNVFIRNTLTHVGEYVAGEGRPFDIYGYKKAYLPLK